MVYEKRYKSHHDSTNLLKHTFISNEDPQNYITNLLATEAKKPRSIYIHVPYCTKICSFCNMNRGLLNKDINDYHTLLIDSIKKVYDYLYLQSKEFESIYFGGGTPTTLSAKQIEEVLQTIFDYLPISSNAEISFETSITELTEDRLVVMKEMGVNRFSIGV
ncbi:MAG: radical SAM protein [Halanaerobiales bacterium]|nr:radical SAM protein [Halanaerobiales bacterium]